MCGIFGWKNIDLKTKEIILNLNKRRGGYSFGFISFLDNKLEEIIKIKQESFERIREKILSKEFVLGEFRAPTTGLNKFVEEENYPLKINENFYLFGNAVINAKFYKKLKEKFNYNINNDLFYIGKSIEKKGLEFLNEIEGVFSLVMVFLKDKKLDKILLARNTFPLFFEENYFSSVKIKKEDKSLKNGVVYDWLNKKEVFKFKIKESPYLLDF